jgi:amino acid adenylation domain-containing protein
LYTSGSTGMPKGVVLSHRHALTFVEWGVRTFAVTPEDRLSNHAPLHFDLSVFDIYVSLHTGACVHIVPDDVAPFPPKLAQWMDEERITVSYSVPSALIRLLGHGNIERFEYRALRAVLFAGEVFPMKYLLQLMQRWPHARYYNLYGPTETNVCTYYEVPADIPADAKEIPIGAAISNCECFAIDDQGKVVQPGGSGELYVRGPLLLLGYWNQPAKTTEMLVPNPIQTAYPEMAYRTGDICRMDSDGNYWFTGRRDHMVKSRGYRIELGDIEAALYKHEGINEAVLVAVPDEEVGARLHAFVVPHAPSLGEKELASFCSSQLPRYMVPEFFWFETELPKTSTGKIDRQALSRRLAEPKT